MRWDIIPWQGVNTVRYGMTDEQVAQALGMQKTKGVDYGDDVRVSFYGIEYTKCFFRLGILYQIEFLMPETTDLVFADIPLFQYDPLEVVDHFIKIDPEFYEELGTYTSGTFGLRLGDFGVNEDERQISVCIFSRQSWNEYWSREILTMKKVSRVG